MSPNALLSSTRQNRKTLAQQRVGGAQHNVTKCALCLQLSKMDTNAVDHELEAHPNSAAYVMIYRYSAAQSPARQLRCQPSHQLQWADMTIGSLLNEDFGGRNIGIVHADHSTHEPNRLRYLENVGRRRLSGTCDPRQNNWPAPDGIHEV
jgi:hypothetical protein